MCFGMFRNVSECFGSVSERLGNASECLGCGLECFGRVSECFEAFRKRLGGVFNSNFRTGNKQELHKDDKGDGGDASQSPPYYSQAKVTQGRMPSTPP